MHPTLAALVFQIVQCVDLHLRRYCVTGYESTLPTLTRARARVRTTQHSALPNSRPRPRPPAPPRVPQRQEQLLWERRPALCVVTRRQSSTENKCWRVPAGRPPQGHGRALSGGPAPRAESRGSCAVHAAVVPDILAASGLGQLLHPPAAALLLRPATVRLLLW